jgi:hypothetical protein
MWRRTVSGCVFLLSLMLNSSAQQKSEAGASAGFEISGTLVNANTGEAIPHARVAIAPVTRRNEATTVITGEDGRFSFAIAKPAKYALAAQARGYLLQSFNQHDQYSSSIAVGPGLDSTNLIFRLAPEGAISGVVTDEGGEPVRDAAVTLYITGLGGGITATRQRGSATTDDEGAYHFAHLPPGRYLVSVNARPWYAQNQTRQAGKGINIGDQIVADAAASPQLDVAYPITFFPGATEAGSATPIVLAAGDKAEADINLQPVAAMHFRAPTNFDFSRGVSVQVRVLDAATMPVSPQLRRDNDDGTWEISGLAPGRYILTQGASDSEKAQSREIDVNSFGDTGKSQGDVYVPVSAKLQFDGGAPSGQTFLQLLNKKSRLVSAERFDADGALVFKQALIPGSYEISLSSGSGVYLKSATATGARVMGRTIDIRPGAEVKLAITAAIGQGSITGTALRAEKGVPGVMIVLVPADAAHNQVMFRRDQSDSDGTFNLPSVVPGAYTLLAIENGWGLEWMKPEVLKNYMAGGVAVQVQSNGKYELKVNVQ